MLVFLADLHLTDGTVRDSLAVDAVDWLARQLSAAAEEASYRRDGSYRPIDRLDLVLLGDVLDFLATDRWTARSSVRPWLPPDSPGLFAQLSRIAEAILRHNEPIVDFFAQLRRQGVGVPPLLRTRSPNDAECDYVPVIVHYVVGERDWFLHLPGAAYDRLREMVGSAFGVAQPFEAPFPHEMIEDAILLDALRRHKVAARHGDAFDPFCYAGDRDSASIFDVFVVELLVRFQASLQRELGDFLDESLTARIRRIHHVYPAVAAPAWLDGILQAACLPPRLQRAIESVWDSCCDEFLRHERVAAWLDEGDRGTRRRLMRLLRFSSRPARDWWKKLIAWHRRLRGAESDSFVVHALAEQDFRNRRAKHIVYAHRRENEIVPLEASFADGYVLDQVFYQTAGWATVESSARLARAHAEPVAFDVRQLPVFFQGDEASGRPFVVSTAVLGRRRGMVRREPAVAKRTMQSADRQGSAAVHGAEAVPQPHFSTAAERRETSPDADSSVERPASQTNEATE
ncbi:MAG: hypothetical protein D6741_02155 [Planctomycetota bacterium]|nr:MAG: hypothetical protein D6741_02155 [Planctomycetota bacterium]